MIAKATQWVKGLFAKPALNRNLYFLSKVQWFIAISWGYKTYSLKEDNLLLLHLAYPILALLWLSAKDQQVAIRNRRLSQIFSQLYADHVRWTALYNALREEWDQQITWPKRNTKDSESLHAKFFIYPHGYDFQAAAVPSENLIWSSISYCTCCLDTTLLCGFYLEQAIYSLFLNSLHLGLCEHSCLQLVISSFTVVGLTSAAQGTIQHPHHHGANSKFALFLQKVIKKAHCFKD